ncbi:MAG: helix-turn-helix transcriptional regulator [Bdellovibrionaceae bacterium]|nr:helix-turn-helix transcriptional regulator [Pseudobdellovibrionaceae bacterium]
MDRDFNLRALRRRMGWTSSDLARRLNVSSSEIEQWENGQRPDNQDVITRIEFLFRQADMCCDEVKNNAMAESFLEESDLDQVDVTRFIDKGN